MVEDMELVDLVELEAESAYQICFLALPHAPRQA